MLLSPVLCIRGVLRFLLPLAAPSPELWQREVSAESWMLCEKQGFPFPRKGLGKARIKSLSTERAPFYGKCLRFAFNFSHSSLSING